MKLRIFSSASVLIFLSGIIIAHAAAPKDLPFSRGTPRRTEKTPFKPQWVSVLKKGKLLKYKRKEYSSPRVSGDFVFVGSDAGTFYAFKKKNGGKAWSFKTKGSFNSSPAFWGDGEESMVLVGDDDGQLYALSQKDGKLLWQTELGSEVLAAASVSGGHAFVASVEGRVASVNVQTGEILWSHEHKVDFGNPLQMTIRGNSPPLVEGSFLYVGFADGVFKCLKAETGKTIWEQSFAKDGFLFNDLDAAPLIDGEKLFIASFDGGVFALNKKTGKVIWSQKAGGASAMTLSEKALYVSGTDGKLYAYDKQKGLKIWEKEIGEGALTAPILYQDMIAVGLSPSTMNFIGASDGRIIGRRFARKGISSDPVLSEDRLYYLSNGGRLYSLRLVR